MNIFVKKNDIIKVEVFIWEESDKIQATSDKIEVPKSQDFEVLTFDFRRPNYADWKTIIEAAQTGGNTGVEVSLNVTKFQDQVLRSLLKDWDLKNAEGEKVSYSLRNLESLETQIAVAAAAGILSKVSF